ncbi:unnamed protein product [Bursaphelenchus xylophilus]|uniref:(pine wood nematode) hypothetical protein n=1 Tax=Bursaphelenchus xylophilus TaxID=6326 RepID=A0A1I7SE94_BURXY|nr:unnamed protein product [Bursaphelenchus xylophilus]CAG9088699.1 unnamed protein product [Bursaphelenchus xylophilus]
MNLECVHSIQICYEISIALIAVILNLLVLMIATRKWKDELHSFSTLVICTTCSDIFFTFTNLFTMQTIQMHDSGLFFFNNNPLLIHISSNTAMILSALWLMGIYIAITNIGFQAYHRYNVVCKSNVVSERAVFQSFLLICVVCGVFCSTVLLTWEHGRFPGSEYEKELNRSAGILSRTNIEFSVADPRIAVGAFHLLGSQMVIMITYSCVIYSCFQIYKILKNEASSMSALTRKANKKLNQVMIIQALFPFILIGFPFVFVVLGTIFQLQTVFIAELMALSITLLPIANALTLLTVIPNYRRRFMRMVRGNHYKVNGSVSRPTATSKI